MVGSETTEEKKEGTQTPGDGAGSESFLVVDSTSTASGQAGTKTANTGKTREEVFLGLNIKKAKLLPSGEVQLGNGKIMGHRKFHYIYKQRPRVPDSRECVLVNKIALEYRKLRALQNGGKGDSLSYRNEVAFKSRVEQEKKFMDRSCKQGYRNSGLQHYFVDPTGHLQ